jgi:hypothetical protein
MSRKTFRRGVKRKALDYIEVSTSPHDAFIAVHFDDETVFMVDLKPSLILSSELTNWSGGNIEPVKEWPKIVRQIPGIFYGNKDSFGVEECQV